MVGRLLINQAISRGVKVEYELFLPSFFVAQATIWGNIPRPHPYFLVLRQTDFSFWSEMPLFSPLHSFLSLRPLLASLPTCLSSWLSTLKPACNWRRPLWNFQAINLIQQSFGDLSLKKKKKKATSSCFSHIPFKWKLQRSMLGQEVNKATFYYFI